MVAALAKLSKRGVIVAMALAMVAIAWWDTVMEQAVAAAVLYIVVILVALHGLRPRSVMVAAAAAVLLTVWSHWWSGHSASQAGWINVCISVLAIVVTASLGLRMKAAQAAAHAAQTRLEQLTRIGNMGALGAAIAHEVNQPLAAIVTSGNACQRWLAQQPPQLERAHQALQRMLDEAVRASNVINRVRGMARGEAPQLEAVALEPLVQEMLQLLHSRLDACHTKARWRPAAALPAVWADAVQLQQVLGNVLLNAMDAVEEAQTRGAVLPAGQAAMEVRAEVIAAQMVCITVQDCGVGLPAAVAEHVFDAFWSTKPQGMGLGLSLCRNMVEAMGGQMGAYTRTDGVTGAVFWLHLPVAAASKA